MKINGVEAARFARYFERVEQPHVSGEQVYHHPTRRKHGRRNDEHLLQMGVRNGLCAARNGVN